MELNAAQTQLRALYVAAVGKAMAADQAVKRTKDAINALVKVGESVLTDTREFVGEARGLRVGLEALGYDPAADPDYRALVEAAVADAVEPYKRLHAQLDVFFPDEKPQGPLSGHQTAAPAPGSRMAVGGVVETTGRSQANTEVLDGIAVREARASAEAEAVAPKVGLGSHVSARAAEAMQRAAKGDPTSRRSAMIDETGRAIPVDEQFSVDEEPPDEIAVGRESGDTAPTTLS